jgi:hypothetical protein
VGEPTDTVGPLGAPPNDPNPPDGRGSPQDAANAFPP